MAPARTQLAAALLVFAAAAGGILGMPCLCSSDMTLSSDGGFSPRGSGSHGFTKTSPMAASMLSLDYIRAAELATNRK
jgi:hypothetical protein